MQNGTKEFTPPMASPAIMYSCRDSRRDEEKRRGEETRRKAMIGG
jgi:hypothetical protein